MAALDEKLGKAIKEKTLELRDQRLRRVWTGVAAGSYALDALFLALFAAAGTISPGVPLAYAAGGALLSAAFYAATASGWSASLEDPGMVAAQTLAGVAMQLGVVWAAPQIAFPYLANVFTVFAFGTVWLSVRVSVLVWLLGTAALGALLFALSDHLAIPASSRFEVALTWLFFSAVLGRCVLLSVHAAAMRHRLAAGRQRLAESLEQIQQLVSHDELTKTLNRRALMSRLEQEKARAERAGGSFSIALIDLDHFKGVNDTHGHAAGDAVLASFAQTVSATMRETDVFGRYGGEEFMLVLTATEPAAARGALERILQAVRATDWSAIAPDLAVSASAGVAGFCTGESLAQLLHRADGALYEAKRAGRDRVCVA